MKRRVLTRLVDSKIYVWHKQNSTLVETLEGHTTGCVNAVAWNPRNPGMFASAGDDRKVRMYAIFLYPYLKTELILIHIVI